MIHAIPNPTKKVTLNFPLEKVKQAVKDLPLKHTRYMIQEEQDAISMYTFSSLEFLSLGVHIDINLAELSDDKTEFNIEIRRAIGSFDQQYEVSRAGRHIARILKAVSELLSDPELGSRLKREAEEKEEQTKREAEENKMTPFHWGIVIFIGLVIGGIVLGVTFSSDDNPVTETTTAPKITTASVVTKVEKPVVDKPIVKKEKTQKKENRKYTVADQEMLMYIHYKNEVPLNLAKKNITTYWSQYNITEKQIEEYYSNQE